LHFWISEKLSNILPIQEKKNFLFIPDHNKNSYLPGRNQKPISPLERNCIEEASFKYLD